VSVQLPNVIIGANAFEGVSLYGPPPGRALPGAFLQGGQRRRRPRRRLQRRRPSFTCSNTPSVMEALQKFSHTPEMSIFPVIPMPTSMPRRPRRKACWGVMSKAKGFPCTRRSSSASGPDQDQERPEQGCDGPPPRAPQLRADELREIHAGRGPAPRPVTDLALSSHNPDIWHLQEVIRDQYDKEPCWPRTTSAPSCPAHGVKIKMPIMAP